MSIKLQLRRLISDETLYSLRDEVRAMSELKDFCFLMYSLSCSTVLTISWGTWNSFALVLSGFPSTDFGAVALMSTPPRPTGLPNPPVLVVATVVVTVVAVAALGAPNAAPNPPPKESVGAAEVLAVAAVAPKDNPVPKAGAVAAAEAPGRANPVEVVVVVAGVVEVPPPKLKAGAAAATAVAAKGVTEVAGLVANAPNAGAAVVGSAVIDAVGVAPNANPVTAGAAEAAVGTAVVEAAGVANENAGALVVGVPKLKPDMANVGSI